MKRPKPRILARNTNELTRAEWLNIRRKGIGGSDAAAICGSNPWRGPLSVYLSKIGAAPDVDPTEIMQWGLDLEPVIAQKFSERTNFKIRRCNMVLMHPEHDWMLANIDRYVKDDTEEGWGVLEVKNVGEYRSSDWEDGPPEVYQIQVQHYLGVTGADYAWLAPLIGGNRLQPVKVMRNERLIASLIKIERDFWHLVETKTPPPLDDSVEATKVLKALYPQSQSTSVVIDPTTYAKFTAVRERIKTLEQEARGYENELRLAMGEAEAAFVPGCEKPVITWKGGTVKKFDTEAFKAENPELAMKYMKEATTRRFLVK